jgi:hypothetical protein
MNKKRAKKKEQTCYYYSLEYSDLTKINTKIRECCESQLITRSSPADIYNKLIATNRLLDNVGGRGLSCYTIKNWKLALVKDNYPFFLDYRKSTKDRD